MITHSESIKELAAALAKAQAEIENAHKNAKNPHFKSTYADLAEIINTVRPVMSAHGLSVVQVPAYAENVVTVETMLMHESGEWLRGETAAPVAKLDPQGVGSATTYLRRYSLAAVCGIAQEDDDGNQASREQAPRRMKTDDVPATNEQRALLEKLIKSHVITPDERTKMQKALANGLTKSRASEAIENLLTTIEERKVIEAQERAAEAGAHADPNPQMDEAT